MNSRVGEASEKLLHGVLLSKGVCLRFGYQDVMSAQSAPRHFILSPLRCHAVMLSDTSRGLSHRCWGDASWAICLDYFTPEGVFSGSRCVVAVLMVLAVA